MVFLGFTVMEWIAILTFIGTFFYSLAKFYRVFVNLQNGVDELNRSINEFREQIQKHDIRFVSIEEQLKTLFEDFKYLKSLVTKLMTTNKKR